MARFAHAKKDWLEQLLELPNGLPSHDAFGDLYAILDPQAFNEYFMQWASPLRHTIDSQVVAIDGKTMRRSHDNSRGLKMVHTVSAWANENKLVLGQLCVEEKSNEITAIPKLLELLWLEGSIVTIDAMRTQKKIAAKIVEKKADYIFSLKENHEPRFVSYLVEDTRPRFIWLTRPSQWLKRDSQCYILYCFYLLILVDSLEPCLGCLLWLL